LRILVLGKGNIGAVSAKDLAQTLPSVEIVVADKKLNQNSHIDNSVFLVQLDASNYRKLVDFAKEFDLVIGALPGAIGYQSVKACIDAKVDMVDISYMPQNPLMLNQDALKAHVTIVPDCGLAPGLSSMLVGHAVGLLDHVENVHVMVGGLPKERFPPLGYTITWSVNGLMDEYTRKARIVQNGKMMEVEPLSGLEKVEFPKVGQLEAFYTDGLRTLPHTVKGVKSMWEKTLRYPGHAKRIRLLKALGFFNEETIKVDDVIITPRKVTAQLFEKKLRRPKIRDIVVMQVDVSGEKEGINTCYTYRLLDEYDEKCETTAMARTTAYPASVVAQFLVQKTIKEKGIVPPEKLGIKENIFKKLMFELKKREICIMQETVQMLDI
jgi:saccharopine dehydrogenase-like NADP-dependent oxidoreductase